MEGRALGREKGFDLWNELGYYKGVISMYKRMIQSQTSTIDDATRKKQRQWQQLESFEALWSLIPQYNDSSGHKPVTGLYAKHLALILPIQFHLT